MYSNKENLQILFEDNHIIIVNKRAGDITQGDQTGDKPLSEVVKEGQIITSPSGGRNGTIFLALNTVDANIYGETRIKFGFNDNSYTNSPIGQTLYLNPDSITVSLSEDNFQYVERGDGLYDCSIRFDLDFWK